MMTTGHPNLKLYFWTLYECSCACRGFLLSFFSSITQAGIAFTGNTIEGDTIQIGLESPDLISYSFSTDFQTSCSPNCGPGQDFRFSFTDASQNGGGGSADDVVLEIQNLNQYTSGNVSYSVDRWSGGFSVGNWSNIMQPEATESNFAATFTFNFSKSSLLEFLDGSKEKEFKFYVIAQEVEATPYHDSIEVSIKIEHPGQVKISGLRDIVFNSAGAQGQLKDGFDLCVYSSTGSAIIEDIYGQCNPGNRFLLGPSGSCSGNKDPNAIRYKLTVTYDGNKTKKHNKDSQRSRYKVNASQSIDCSGGSNLRFDVEINEADYIDKAAGVYSDTLTVTISPEG